jgi:hypothetical protein
MQRAIETAAANKEHKLTEYVLAKAPTIIAMERLFSLVHEAL